MNGQVNHQQSFGNLEGAVHPELQTGALGVDDAPRELNARSEHSEHKF